MIDKWTCNCDNITIILLSIKYNYYKLYFKDDTLPNQQKINNILHHRIKENTQSNHNFKTRINKSIRLLAIINTKKTIKKK